MTRVIRNLNRFPVNVTHHGLKNGAYVASSFRDLAKVIDYDGGAFHTYAKWPVKNIFEEANDLNAKVWLPIPHRFKRADFDKLARQIKRLKPKHKPILEYSNEVWNGGMFIHQVEAGREGEKLGLLKDPGADADKNMLRNALLYQAYQTIQLREAFGDSAEIVLCGQATNPWLIDQWTIQAMPAVVDAIDAVAAAFYWKDEAELNKVPERVAKWKALADRIGKQLWGYEGGQHATAANTKQWSASAEIGTLYGRYLDMLEDGGVSLVCLYSLWSKHWNNPDKNVGEAWGLVDVANATKFSNTPKFNAVHNFRLT